MGKKVKFGVFADLHVDIIHDAKERLVNAGYTCGVYDGKVKREDREKDYTAFENKEIQILFVNQASGAYGLDGLKKANYAIYLCNSYSVEQREQSEDRIYRGLVSTNKYIIDLTCQGTCEDRVTEALKQGKQLLDTGMTDASLFILEE
jgi:SNF2 family DNA or RNA helicase